MAVLTPLAGLPSVPDDDAADRAGAPGDRGLAVCFRVGDGGELRLLWTTSLPAEPAAYIGPSWPAHAAPDPSSVPREAFEAMVVDALDTLPEPVLSVVDEIAVLVEDEPAPGEGRLLGQFRGVPRTRYGGRAPGTLPDTITLFRLPILRACPTPEEVPARVRRVLQHEVGHALGLSEDRLRALGCC